MLAGQKYYQVLIKLSYTHVKELVRDNQIEAYFVNELVLEDHVEYLTYKEGKPEVSAFNIFQLLVARVTREMCERTSVSWCSNKKFCVSPCLAWVLHFCLL